ATLAPEPPFAPFMGLHFSAHERALRFLPIALRESPPAPPWTQPLTPPPAQPLPPITAAMTGETDPEDTVEPVHTKRDPPAEAADTPNVYTP
ncbi:MAG: hypothetical protein ACOC3I_08145, partial [Verrucomicrobiota bacterium]